MDGQLLGHLGLLVVQVIGYVAVFPQEGEELEQKLAEVFANAEPPWRKITDKSTKLAKHIIT